MSTVEAPPDLRAQINGLIFAFLLIDEGGEIVEANAASEHLLGQSAGRLVGQKLLDVLEIDDDRVTSRLGEEATVIARGLTVSTSERSFVANLTASPIGDAGWRVVTFSDAGQSALADHISDHGAIGAPGILAHEIKNPLAAIRGASQLLSRRLDGNELDLAKLIAGEVDRIASLIDRMQRLGSNVTEASHPFNLHEAIRNALETLTLAKDGTVKIVEEFDPSLPPVLGHREALEQVIINLVSNAQEACGDNAEAEITLTTRFVSGRFFNLVRPGRNVRLPIELVISDNGPGVDPMLRDRIFEPFVSSKTSGQGLGLALVRKLVRDMEGRIAHERDDKAGLTSFRIHLPMARAGEQAA